MGSKIQFFREAQAMRQLTVAYHIVALCPHCRAIRDHIPDDPTDKAGVEAKKEEWKRKGYVLDRFTRALVWARYSVRGCPCEAQS